MTVYPILTNRLISVWTSEPIFGPPDSWVSTKLPDPDLAQSRTHMLPLVFSDLKSPPICCSTRKAKKRGGFGGKNGDSCLAHATSIKGNLLLRPTSDR